MCEALREANSLDIKTADIKCENKDSAGTPHDNPVQLFEEVGQAGPVHKVASSNQDNTHDSKCQCAPSPTLSTESALALPSVHTRHAGSRPKVAGLEWKTLARDDDMGMGVLCCQAKEKESPS